MERFRSIAIALVTSALGCGDAGGDGGDTGGSDGTTGGPMTMGEVAATTPETTTVDATSVDPEPTTTTTTTTTSATTESSESGADSSSSGEPPDPGPMVDVSDPQLYEFELTADEADPAAMQKLATQQAQLDTRAVPLGRLVVYLHGAGAPSLCGGQEHGRLLAAMGFHVVQPCYVSDYGVANCGDDIGGCRMEAFEGVEHHPFITIDPPDSIETRVVRMLEWLQAMHPGGDWQYFIEDGAPRWDRIVISGISHGASSSAIIGKHREVDRVVSLSGPLDTDQAWLLDVSMTPIDRFWAFTHSGDEQHEGHLGSFEDLGLVGEPALVDGAAPPYGGSHRLVTSAPTGDGHGSTQAGGASPMDGDAWAFEPVWRLMYGAAE